MAVVTRGAARHEERSNRLLRVAAVLFAVAVLVHNADHLRRGGNSVSADVFAVGTLGMVVEVMVVALVLSEHRLAPFAAAAVGASLTAGYVLVHLSPHRSWLSDSLTVGRDVTWLSWVAVIALITASLLLAVAGTTIVRQGGGHASTTRPRPREGRAVHPVVAVLAAGNLIVLIGSFATL